MVRASGKAAATSDATAANAMIGATAETAAAIDSSATDVDTGVIADAAGAVLEAAAAEAGPVPAVQASVARQESPPSSRRRSTRRWCSLPWATHRDGSTPHATAGSFAAPVP